MGPGAARDANYHKASERQSGPPPTAAPPSLVNPLHELGQKSALNLILPACLYLHNGHFHALYLLLDMSSRPCQDGIVGGINFDNQF